MPGALSAALHLDPQKRHMLVNGLVAHWTELDPRAAGQYASSLSSDQQYAWVRSNALAVWADKDFAAASQYALALAPGKKRNDALGGIASGLAKKDPVAALNFFEENLKNTTANEGMNIRSMIVQRWAQKDFDAAAKYALTIQDRQTRRDMLSRLSYSEMNKSAQDFLNWAKEIPDRESRVQLTDNALSNWSHKDPQAVLQYARTLQPGSIQENAMADRKSTRLNSSHGGISRMPSSA